MDGRAWLEIFEDPPRLERIESWETVEGACAMHAGPVADAGDSAEMIRRLVQLGYLEPPDEDAQKAVQKAERDAKINLALALAQSRRAAKAIDLWRQLADAYPEEEGFLVQLAICQVRLQRFGQARQSIERMSDGLRALPVVRLLEASLALATGDRDAALAHTRAAREADDLGTALLNRAGEVFLNLQRWDEAEEAFTAALECDEDNPVAHDGLAQVRLAQDAPQAAAEHALRAVGLMHFFPAAHFHLGEALERTHRPAEALAAFETSLQLGYLPRAAHLKIAALADKQTPDKAAWHRWAAERL
jgi:tetratricopeptide (TPR) repeat protein